ncbi:hypothetical protein F2P81_026344 [Scophthalmus maximus]|uniref:Uncharacterized protein n=1 Tax=Scophthalmus maximus TaxID=52904 RepID=A0A6A4RQV1_SCOMX|nr:hypothetical protein F2P81_026344 [Scophthalmus maximus]
MPFSAAASPSLVPSLFSLKVACAQKDGKRDMKKNARVCQAEKVFVAVYVDGTSHGSVGPGFDTVQGGGRCKTRGE